MHLLPSHGVLPSCKASNNMGHTLEELNYNVLSHNLFAVVSVINVIPSVRVHGCGFIPPQPKVREFKSILAPSRL